jgi:hypothetical protein
MDLEGEELQEAVPWCCSKNNTNSGVAIENLPINSQL